MKKVALGGAVILVLVASGLAFGGSIVGSRHDFSFPGGDSPFAGNFQTHEGEIDEVCVFCHTPHSASTDSGRRLNTLLWNRTNSTFTYSVYSSSTLNVSPDNPPKGITLMCMSCHDGVTSIAVGTLLNAPGSGNPPVTKIDPGIADKIGQIYDGGFLGWGANIGEGNPNAPGTINLSNDHPVSFTWISNLPGIRPDTAIGFSDSTVKLFYGRMECATCHKVHDPDIVPFLRMSNTGSALCLRCHDK